MGWCISLNVQKEMLLVAISTSFVIKSATHKCKLGHIFLSFNLEENKTLTPNNKKNPTKYLLESIEKLIATTSHKHKAHFSENSLLPYI